MAIFQMSNATLDVEAGAIGGPLIVLYERDDAIAVPLLSQLRLAGYDVRASRTPVELFDTLSKNTVALVLIDLGNATAGRREFWVALDAQRRGRQLQAMTFRYLQEAGPFDTDFQSTPRAIADVEVRGVQDFQAIIAGVRQRVSLHGRMLELPGAGAGPGVISPLPPGSMPSPFAQGLGATANPYSASGGLGAGSSYYLDNSVAAPGPAFGMPAAPYGQPFGQPPSQSSFGASFPASPFTPSAAQPGFGIPPAPPTNDTSPFAAGQEASPFAQPYSANPFAADVAAAPARQAAPAPFGQPQRSAASAPPQWLVGSARPAGDPVEERAARLSEMYAAQFSLPGQEQSPPVRAPFGGAEAQGWDMGYGQPNGFGGAASNSLGNGHAANGFGLPSMNGFGGDPYAAFGAAPAMNGAANGHAGFPDYGVAGAERPFEPERSGAPVADVWTPPVGDLDFDTSVVPEMAYQSFAEAGAAPVHSGRHAASAQTWTAPASLSGDGDESVDTLDTAAYRRPRRTGEPTAPVPAPSRLPAVRMTAAEQALGSVLIEGALLSSDKLEVLRGIQQMLASVDMDFKLGELALLFKFLSPDQLLAALLVSRGLVSPQQIAGLGRVKQELAASGMDYNLETLLTMFHIMPVEQLHVLRAELGG